MNGTEALQQQQQEEQQGQEVEGAEVEDSWVHDVVEEEEEEMEEKDWQLGPDAGDQHKEAGWDSDVDLPLSLPPPSSPPGPGHTQPDEEEMEMDGEPPSQGPLPARQQGRQQQLGSPSSSSGPRGRSPSQSPSGAINRETTRRQRLGYSALPLSPSPAKSGRAPRGNLGPPGPVAETSGRPPAPAVAVAPMR